MFKILKVGTLLLLLFGKRETLPHQGKIASLFFSGCSCLHVASQGGQLPIVAYLLAKGMVNISHPVFDKDWWKK